MRVPPPGSDVPPAYSNYPRGQGTTAGTVEQLEGDTGSDIGFQHKETAVLWQDSQIYDLNSRLMNKPPVSLETAVAINGKGQILALAMLQNTGFAEFEVYLLTPKP